MTNNQKVPSNSYSVLVDRYDSRQWSDFIRLFSDASIYQTVDYGQRRWSQSELNHLVLSLGNTPVAAVQIMLKTIPFIGGIAYIRWGPLWRRTGQAEDIEVFRQAIRAIRKEFVEKRGCMVRMIPREIDSREDIQKILEDEKFRCMGRDYNTMLIDISGDEQSIRAGLVARWRTDLNRCQRNGLKMCSGEDIELYDRFAPIYEEMFDRKNLVDFGDLDVYRKLQTDLPDNMKMKIMLCALPGEPDGAGAITSAIGDTGLAILWATNRLGRDSKGAYFLQWEVIRWLKQQGCRWYDLGGVNKDDNPGGYRFKCGLGGKQGREVQFLGQFQASPSRFRGALLERVLELRNQLRRLRIAAKGLFSRGL